MPLAIVLRSAGIKTLAADNLRSGKWPKVRRAGHPSIRNRDYHVMVSDGVTGADQTAHGCRDRVQHLYPRTLYQIRTVKLAVYLFIRRFTHLARTCTHKGTHHLGMQAKMAKCLEILVSK